MNNGNENCSGCAGIWWWMTLVVAVLAVPSFGIIVARLIPMPGVGELIVFVLACWFCTYLGMRLMKNPKMMEKIGKK